jgi:segregation and condensation protein B
MKNDLDKKIEAILFYSSEPLYIDDISSVVDEKKEDVLNALEILKSKLSDRGIALVEKDNFFSLATSKDFSDLIEKMVKMELNKDLTSASLETLSIILYKSPVSKKEIEYIRGVNSSFSIRNLLLRGLIEREQSRLDERVYFYKPSRDLFLHLGISDIKEMPEYMDVKKELEVAVNSVNKTVTLENQDDQ